MKLKPENRAKRLNIAVVSIYFINFIPIMINFPLWTT